MRLLALVFALATVQTAAAAECEGRYSADIFEPGVMTAEVHRSADGGLGPSFKLQTKGEAAKIYTLQCSGSPASCSLMPDDDLNAEPLGFLEHKGALIIDMVVYEPECKAQ